MNKRLLSVLIFAVVVSAAASLILYRLLTAQWVRSRASGDRVVVASHNLDNGSLIREADVKVVDWGGPVPQGAFLRPDDVIGRGVVEPITEGEAIVERRIAARGAGAGLAATIPPGKRAVAVRVNDVVGLAGFVTPGMHVDVLIAGTPPGGATTQLGTLTRTLLQNIEVLSAGQNIQKDAEGKPVQVQVVNLLVSPEEAESLSLANNETKIQLVLRNPMDQEVAKTTGTAIANLFGRAPQEQPEPPKTTPRVTRPIVAKVIPTPPVAPEPVKPAVERVIVPITVELIHGAKKTEVKFQNEEKPTGEKSGTDAGREEKGAKTGAGEKQ